VHIKEDESTGTGSGGDVRAVVAASDWCTGSGGRSGGGVGGRQVHRKRRRLVGGRRGEIKDE